MEIITRPHAKASGRKRYYTGKLCKNGHLSERAVASGSCLECAATILAAWRADNHDRVLGAHRKSYAKNREKVRARQAVYRKENADRVRLMTASWAQKNPEMVRSAINTWRDKNRDRVNAGHARRRAAKLKAEPSWLTKKQHDEIRMFYLSSAEMSAFFGVEHAVDHIVPLQAEEACGLHVPWNLRVITRTENCRKQNRLQE